MKNKLWDKSVLLWEIGGAHFIILIGAALHFVFEWSGYADAVGVFAPVNESVWEHLKLGFTPLVLFSTVEYRFIRRKVANFFMAKLLGALAMMCFIGMVFFTYTAFTGRPILAVDISSFVFGAFLCQAIALLVYFRTRSALPARIAGGAGLVLISLCFAIFTFFPPRFGLFRDRPHNTYGPVRTETRGD